MAGLLDNKLGDFLKGAGTAAAFGANPLIGLLTMGGFANERERREAENKLMRDQMQARDELQGLLARRTDVIGPGRQIPAVIPENAEQIGMEAINIPGMRGSVPSFQTPQGQQEMLGILAKINPEAAIGQALPQQQRTNTTQQKIDALLEEAARRGYGPQETEQFVDANLSTQSPLEAILAAETLRQRQRDNELAEQEAQQQAEARSQAEALQQSAVRRSLENIRDLADANQTLSAQPFLRPGWGADVRGNIFRGYTWAKGAIGLDAGEEEAASQVFTTFEKSAANLLQDLLPQLEGINANTDNRLNQIKKSLADIGTEPGTNAKILSSTIYDILDIADINNFEIEGKKEMYELARELKNFKVGDNKTPAEGTIATNRQTGERLIYRGGQWVPYE